MAATRKSCLVRSGQTFVNRSNHDRLCWGSCRERTGPHGEECLASLQRVARIKPIIQGLEENMINRKVRKRWINNVHAACTDINLWRKKWEWQGGYCSRENTVDGPSFAEIQRMSKRIDFWHPRGEGACVPALAVLRLAVIWMNRKGSLFLCSENASLLLLFTGGTWTWSYSLHWMDFARLRTAAADSRGLHGFYYAPVGAKINEMASWQQKHS